MVQAFFSACVTLFAKKERFVSKVSAKITSQYINFFKNEPMSINEAILIYSANIFL